MEHILTLRLLIDCAKKNKSKLFILFIDFEKAYDKIVRTKLIEELKRLGCGMIMLKVIVAMYRNTSFLFNQIANRGVKQGFTTSCFLFIIYVDCMVRKMKESFALDGFLGTLHILMLCLWTTLHLSRHQSRSKHPSRIQAALAQWILSLNFCHGS